MARGRKPKNPVDADELMDVELPHKYNPRHYQEAFWEYMLTGNPSRRAILVHPRRHGKDVTAFNWTVYAACAERPGVYYYFAPTYAHGKKFIWDNIISDGITFHDFIPKELLIEKSEVEMSWLVRNIKGGHSRIQIIGTDKFNGVVGPNPVGCVFSEYSLMRPTAFNLVRPILTENKGWALFVYTPRGKNHAYDLFEAAQKNPRWFAERLTCEDTRRPDGSLVMSLEDIQEERSMGMPEELIQQEYYCSFSGCMEGAYYASILQNLENQGKIGDFEYNPDYPISTSWDIGISDSTAIWFYQDIGLKRIFIDYLEGTGEGFPYYMKQLSERPYIYARHIVPHDFGAREFSTGESPLKIARRNYKTRFTVADKLPVAVGIDATRRMLVRSCFDAQNCEDGLSALRQYHKEFNEEKSAKHKAFFSNKPEHDWSSNAADALRMAAVTYKAEKPERTGQQQKCKTDFSVFNYNQGQNNTSAITNFSLF